MPKTVTLSRECTGVSASEFCSLTYCSKEFLQGYHAAVNNDPDAVIPDFERHDSIVWKRVVEFTVPVKAPSIIMRMIGSASQLQVLEAQCVSIVQGVDANEVHIESKPRPQLGSIGDGFTSDVRVVIVDTGRGCRVNAMVEVSASSAPYGMVGIVETFMADTAKASVHDLLEHMCSAVENLRENDMLSDQVERNVEEQHDMHAWLGLVPCKNDAEWAPSEYHSVYYSDTNESIVDALQAIAQKMDALQKTLDRVVSNDMSMSIQLDSSVWWFASSMIAGALVASYIIPYKGASRLPYG